jgi:hypothetical protein
MNREPANSARKDKCIDEVSNGREDPEVLLAAAPYCYCWCSLRAREQVDRTHSIVPPHVTQS